MKITILILVMLLMLLVATVILYIDGTDAKVALTEMQMNKTANIASLDAANSVIVKQNAEIIQQAAALAVSAKELRDCKRV
jgi:hypothetical protein